MFCLIFFQNGLNIYLFLLDLRKLVKQYSKGHICISHFFNTDEALLTLPSDYADASYPEADFNVIYCEC